MEVSVGRIPGDSDLNREHTLNGFTCSTSDPRSDRYLVLHVAQCISDILKVDAFHVGTEVARSKKFSLRRFGGDIVTHRTFGNHNDLTGSLVFYPVYHSGCRPDEVSFLQYVWRTFWMRDDLDSRIQVPISPKFFGRETLVHLA